MQQEPGEGGEIAERRPPKKKNEVLEWIKAIAIALVLVILIRWLLFKPFIVDGPSMKPSFHTGERVIVNEILYKFREPERGEVIVFHVPQEGRDFIKRVIGVAGDKVQVEGDVVTVNGKPIDEPYLKKALEQAHENNQLWNDKNFPNETFPNGTVPDGHVFVMGDNRSDSTDSRMIGYVSLDEIVGRADLVFWPLKDFTWIKH
ncbi:signal peptidase I [Paenibacillus spiritus]|uniref:Signal peptidase I n=1 Tax=Paenibacillus spiritus TaxID=2496557 RepID=A0A5J5GEV2_9BACL|nr:MULTISPECIES: signal peptidase I [Paenibacillus]KAA9006621.1 signal peptidase I [Paenibacillus spiritus]